MITVISKRDRIKDAFRRWKERYGTIPDYEFMTGEKVKDITARLEKLDPNTCSEQDVDKAIGRPNWAALNCQLCDANCSMAAMLQTGDHDDEGKYVIACIDCLAKAIMQISDARINDPERTLTLQQVLDAMIRFKKYIADGGEEWHFDCEAVGDKDSQASWGLCCRVKEMWPDKATRLFDTELQLHLRLAKGVTTFTTVSLKALPSNGNCPMDRRGETNDPSGCFFHCKIFNPKGEKRPNKERALQLYNIAIDRLRNRIG